MPNAKTITIIGGGLAGLALGIGLRRGGAPVTIWEAGTYPRHRVCGEFISGRGQGVLERLELLPQCGVAGAIYARTAKFWCGANESPVHALPTPALCLSRYRLDAVLAGSFAALGGELRANSRWMGAWEQEGLVRAAGRRTSLAESPARWFGVKAHVRSGMKLEADLEMHVGRDGYVGANGVGNGEINVCGLFRAGGRRPESKQEWLRGGEGSRLRRRLAGMEFDADSFCSVGGLELRPQRGLGRSECCIGDALTMTPPVTGNGMSMAFESAEMATGPLLDYSCGRRSWGEARQEIARSCDAAFAGRLAWASFLQWLLLSRGVQGRYGGVLLRSGRVWRFLFTRTRN